MGGPVAEDKFTDGAEQPGSYSDYETAFSLALQICGSTEEGEAYLNFMWEQTKNIMELNWEAVEKLSGKLIEQKLLTYRTVREFVGDLIFRVPLL